MSAQIIQFPGVVERAMEDPIFANAMNYYFDLGERQGYPRNSQEAREELQRFAKRWLAKRLNA